MEAADEVEEELEAVLAIILDGIDIIRNPNCIIIKAQISPLTALDSEQCFVGYLLELSLEKKYPEIPPMIKIRNPRGMSEEQIEELYNLMKLKCQEFVGGPVIFELLDLGREYLTQSNIPKAAPCSICLYDFDDNDTFCKTKCFHHFHSYCLGRYLKALQDDFNKKQIEDSQSTPRSILDTGNKKCEMLCPICRLDISDMEVEKLLMAPEPMGSVEDKSTVVITPDLQKLQMKMKKMYIKQLNIGGIIDKEAEEKRFLIVTAPSEDESLAISTDSSLPTSEPHRPLPTPKKDDISEGKDTSSSSRNWDRRFMHSKTKQQKHRMQRTVKSNIKSDRTNMSNGSETVNSRNENSSINTGACDIATNQSNTRSSYNNNNSYRGRNKGHRYKPRPS